MALKANRKKRKYFTGHFTEQARARCFPAESRGRGLFTLRFQACVLSAAVTLSEGSSESPGNVCVRADSGR